KAELRLRVADVQRMTIDIESLTQSMNGLVVNSELVNEISTRKDLPYSNDSLKQVATYSTTSFMEVKVPSLYLDSFLRVLSAKSEFIYKRKLNIEDASLQYLNNDLYKNNKAAHDDIGRARPLVKKTEDAMQIADHVALKSEAHIDREIANM